MIITKRQLMQIIREAMVQGPDLGRGKDFAVGGSGEGKGAAMSAADAEYYKMAEGAVQELENAVMTMLKTRGKEDTIAELQNLVMDIKTGKLK